MRSSGCGLVEAGALVTSQPRPPTAGTSVTFPHCAGGAPSYLPLADGTNPYPATVIDCARPAPGRLGAARPHAHAPLVIEALQQAAATRGSLKGAVLHAGHGSVHTSKDFAAECKRLEVTQSMGAVGSSAAGAPAESFNATLKREVLTGEHSWTDELTRRRQTLQVAHPRTTPYAATPTAATHPQPPTRNRPQPLRRQPPRKPTPVSNNKRQGPHQLPPDHRYRRPSRPGPPQPPTPPGERTEPN